MNEVLFFDIIRRLREQMLEESLEQEKKQEITIRRKRLPNSHKEEHNIRTLTALIQEQ
jgi:hypothetical protein